MPSSPRASNPPKRTIAPPTGKLASRKIVSLEKKARTVKKPKRGLGWREITRRESTRGDRGD